MSQFVLVPYQRLDPEALQGLLEEFASRDGTDYGEYEFSLPQKVEQLLGQLQRGDLQILFDVDGEHWDVLPREEADLILDP